MTTPKSPTDPTSLARACLDYLQKQACFGVGETGEGDEADIEDNVRDVIEALDRLDALTEKFEKLEAQVRSFGLVIP